MASPVRHAAYAGAYANRHYRPQTGKEAFQPPRDARHGIRHAAHPNRPHAIRRNGSADSGHTLLPGSKMAACGFETTTRPAAQPLTPDSGHTFRPITPGNTHTRGTRHAQATPRHTRPVNRRIPYTHIQQAHTTQTGYARQPISVTSLGEDRTVLSAWKRPANRGRIAQSIRNPQHQDHCMRRRCRAVHQRNQFGRCMWQGPCVGCLQKRRAGPPINMRCPMNKPVEQATADRNP